MIIPNKYSGYQAGIRVYPLGGGGGGGGGSPEQPAAPVAPPPPPPPPWANMGVNTQQGYDTLMQAKGQPWEQSGGVYNSLLNQGFTSNQIRDSATQVYGAPSNANWTGMVQNAGMTSPTGRPMAGSDQFYQPIYQPQYNNYVNPLLSGNVSQYGTNPGPSAGFMSATAPGGMGLDSYYANLRTFGSQQSSQPGGMNYATFNPARKQLGADMADLQRAYEYNPQQQFSGFGGGFMPQMQQPFNPYTNSFGGGFGGGFMPQQQFMPQMQSPFSFQPQFQPQMNMQTPFSSGMSQPRQQPQPAAPRSSGPSQAIVGRSSQMRGTPNVMRRAQGGITNLLDKK